MAHTMPASVPIGDEQNSRLERRVLIGWNLLLVGVFLSIALCFIPKLYQSRRDAEKRHAARMNPVAGG
jgi:hypothetical protein